MDAQTSTRLFRRAPRRRGVGNKIAIWRYQDPNVVTQLSADCAQAVRNLLDSEADEPAAARRQPEPSPSSGLQGGHEAD
eukprot:12892784-Alexandrium_andersonii.AAC.1